MMRREKNQQVLSRRQTTRAGAMRWWRWPVARSSSLVGRVCCEVRLCVTAPPMCLSLSSPSFFLWKICGNTAKKQAHPNPNLWLRSARRVQRRREVLLARARRALLARAAPERRARREAPRKGRPGREADRPTGQCANTAIRSSLQLRCPFTRRVAA